MTPLPLRLLAAPALLASTLGCSPGPCPVGATRADDGLCYMTSDEATDSGGDAETDTGGDTGTSNDLLEGDPITIVGFEGEHVLGGQLLEWTDAAILSDTVGAVCGIAGVGLVDLTDGSTLSLHPSGRCLRMAESGGVLVASDRRAMLTILDVENPPDMLELGVIRFDPEDVRHEDIAIDARRILVGWHGNGGQIYDPGGNLLGTLPATDAFAVGLRGSRAVISDAEELVLWDVTDPRSPVELSRVALPGEGRDIEFDGDRVAIAMGGAGVGVWDVQDDTLVPRGSVIVPGAGLAVALDGDEVWVGSWQHTVLLRLTDDGLITMGHEAPRFSAMGVAARDGTALVADWHGHMTLQRQRDVSSAEIIINEDLYFPEDDTTQHLRVENHGQFPLEWAVGALPDGFSVSEEAVTVAPGGVEVVRVEGPVGLEHRDALPWTSNDPDESAGEIALAPPDRGVGSEHPDFSLQGFVWPDRDPTEYTLSAHRGKVVVLAYFALF